MIQYASELDIDDYPQMPLQPMPIIIIGAGGIVSDAHLPAYQLAGFPVYGIIDIDFAKAQKVAADFNIPNVFASVDEAVEIGADKMLYDIALPAVAIIPILKKLPDGAAVLIQKPMGDNLAEAEMILTICRTKKLKAAMNFQLRYAPFMLAAKDIITKGLIGEVCDISFNINVYTPWHLWQFMKTIPRVEISYHSIHYIDFIRSLLGNPTDVFGKTTKHPNSPGLASVRSDIIMDYGDSIRANIHTNHNHNFGTTHQQASIKIEGTHGAVKIQMGLLINYPSGIDDKFEFVSALKNAEPVWQEIKVHGSWFPHAFIGSISQLMCYAEGSSKKLDNSVEDAIWTMRCVEAAYEIKQASKYLVTGR